MLTDSVSPPVSTAATAAPQPDDGESRSRKPLAIVVGVAAIAIVGATGYALTSRQGGDAAATANVEAQVAAVVADGEPTQPDAGSEAIADDAPAGENATSEPVPAVAEPATEPAAEPATEADEPVAEPTTEADEPVAEPTTEADEPVAAEEAAAAIESPTENPATDDTALDDIATDATDESAAAGGTGNSTSETAEPETVDADTDASANTGDAATLPTDVPESKGVVRNGQIYLEGAVPTAEAGAEIAMLAAEILGADNVFNNYVVDPRAGDPNLGNLTVEDTINFATNSSIILPEGESLLNQGLALMTIRPAMTMTIVGHTDSRGSDANNLWLSNERADAVKQWFVERGIDPTRLTAVGVGESEPIADNATSEGRRLNRRIQVILENLLGTG